MMGQDEYSGVCIGGSHDGEILRWSYPRIRLFERLKQVVKYGSGIPFEDYDFEITHNGSEGETGIWIHESLRGKNWMAYMLENYHYMAEDFKKLEQQYRFSRERLRQDAG